MAPIPDPSHGLTRENMLAAFPVALREDTSIAALADAVAGVLAERREEIDRLRIYSAVDQLEEPLLDILAHDFKVDWWNPNYSLAEKRRTLKGSWQVHKTLGTKAAVVTAVAAVYPDAQVLEWFEYGGRPHYFKLLLGTHPSTEEKRQILSAVEMVKRKSQWLDKLVYQCITAVPNHPEAFLPVSLRIRCRIWNLRMIPPVTWDGAETFGGYLQFDQRLAGSGSTLRLAVRTKLPRQTKKKVTAQIAAKGAVRSEVHSCATTAFQARAAPLRAVTTGEQSPRQIHLRTGVRNESSTSAILRAESRCDFDGVYSFDGSRRFKAGVTITEI